jgi:tetratricopeptide (TPR) repeat protein
MPSSSRTSRLCDLGALLLLMLCTRPLHACLWDFDTLRDEKRGLPGVAELLSGRYEQHSKFFYEHRIAKMKALLLTEPQNWPAYDNLAVAYEKLDDHEAAIATMLRKDQLNPGQYTTFANLGTFYLHQGQLEKGIECINKALAINPKAHFGREWVQLKLAEYYVAAKKDPSLLRKQDFFGASEFGLYLKQPPDDHFLIANGQSSVELKPDAFEGIVGIFRFGTGNSAELYFVLGEMLEQRAIGRHGASQMHLAYRAYLRAIELNHPRSQEIRDHLYQVFNGAKEHDPTGYQDTLIARERADGAAWLKAYQAYEDALVRAGKDTDDESNYAAFYADHPRIDNTFHISDARSWFSRKLYKHKLEWSLALFAFIAIPGKILHDRRSRRKRMQTSAP